MRLRVICTGLSVAGDRLYAVQVRDWFRWREVGTVWAANPDDALTLAGKEAACEVEADVRDLEALYRR